MLVAKFRIWLDLLNHMLRIRQCVVHAAMQVSLA